MLAAELLERASRTHREEVRGAAEETLTRASAHIYPDGCLLQEKFGLKQAAGAAAPIAARYCGMPSTARTRNLAYLLPIFLFSFNSAEFCQALTFSMLSHCWIAMRFARAPSNATTLLLAARNLPPCFLINACAFGTYSLAYASGLLTLISARTNTGGLACA